jgi:SAM-dependent methyltransferase
MSTASKFTRDGVRDYEKRRYRGLDQRIVHAREMRLLKKAFARIDRERAAESAGHAWGEERRTLDLPCGYGRFTNFLKGPGRAVVNSDLSLEMVRRAAEASGTPGAVANATAGLPFKDGSFETVFSIRFFHHLHDPAVRTAVLSEFRRTTGRWAVVSFYRLSGLHAAQRRLRRRFGKSRTNIKMIEPGEFEREAEAAGFEVAAVRPLFRGLHAYHLALLRKKSG